MEFTILLALLGFLFGFASGAPVGHHADSTGLFGDALEISPRLVYPTPTFPGISMKHCGKWKNNSTGESHPTPQKYCQWLSISLPYVFGPEQPVQEGNCGSWIELSGKEHVIPQRWCNELRKKYGYELLAARDEGLEITRGEEQELNLDAEAPESTPLETADIDHYGSWTGPLGMQHPIPSGACTVLYKERFSDTYGPSLVPDPEHRFDDLRK